MIRPRALKTGDTVGLLAPSGAASPEKIRLSINALERLGLTVAVGESCFARHGYFAGDDRLRAGDLNRMFADDAVSGIFAIRGGYGAQRLLGLIDYDLIKKNPKVFAGYSDTTALHIVFNQRCALMTYHTPMPATELYKEALDGYTKQSLLRHLFGGEPAGSIENPPGEQMITICPGIAEGRITGGNLSLAVSSIGTPYEIDARGKILFLEEIGEEPYRIDRMLLQMKYAGKFRDCAGILLGAFTDCAPRTSANSLSLSQIFQEILLPENKPAVYNFRCGHCLPTATIPLGAAIRLDAGKQEIVYR